MPLPRFLGRVTGNFFSQLFSYAIGGAISNVLNPALYPLQVEAWRQHPVALLSPDELANAVVQGHLDQADAANEALGWGVSNARFDLMVATAGMPPGVQDILALWDRGAMNEAEVTEALRETRLKPKYVETVKALQRNYLSPGEAAAMVVQGILTLDQGAAIARISSVEREDFERLVRVNGLPPGVETGLELWRRGAITEGEFETLVRQGHTKTEYIDPLKQLKHDHLSPEVAAQMVVQSIVTEEAGAKIAALSGTTAEDFHNMVLVRGRPPGPAEALDWLRRGILTEADFAQVIRESNVKTKYTGSYLEALERLPTLVQVRSMFKSGTIPRSRAENLLHKHGWAPDIITAYLDAVTQAKKPSHHELTEAQTIALYQSGLRTREEALADLDGIGYNQHDAGELLDLADARRVNSARSAALNRIHREFVAGLLNEETVSQALDQLKIVPTVKDDLLAAWDVERTSVTKTLTEAQVARGVKLKLIEPNDGATRLYNMGYSEADAHLLLSIQAGIDWSKVPPPA